MIIAVDGPTASGKGTIAKALAEHYGLPFLDTGLLYRAVGFQLLQNGGDPDSPDDALEACEYSDDILEHPELRDEAIGGLASRVSVHPEVRAALNKRQVDFAYQPGGALLDGRDIGTVIAPDADVKLFITASANVRAERRYREMKSRGVNVEFETILADIQARDIRDAGRTTAPLKPAVDAIEIDTSNMSVETAIQSAVTAVDSKVAASRA
ncbi:MAG TPA: (d)CMP kinase [Sphingorhabdus lacus]|jgi:cytidylate kinase|uniref:(d)CMP kinase n=1 Tax=Sphingorhabdus lacus TaxID=392610 RepID=UPI002C1A8106|nr:(d)CMP kinase [Sphingorhabdus lacus]HPV68641.1 (d)CMP kinase [Sphingorhabdus lacus]